MAPFIGCRFAGPERMDLDDRRLTRRALTGQGHRLAGLSSCSFIEASAHLLAVTATAHLLEQLDVAGSQASAVRIAASCCA